MKIFIHAVLWLLLGSGTAQAASVVVATFDVTNPAALRRQDDAVLLPLQRLGLGQTDNRLASLIAVEGQRTYPVEAVDSDGDGHIDALVLISDYAGRQIRRFKLVSGPGRGTPAIKRTQAEISIKQGGEWKGSQYEGGQFVNVDYVKPPAQYAAHSAYIRYEGPGIESDKVGYRVYLDPRNGFDIFGKKIPAMVLQQAGHDDKESYENDAPWGLDILKVGESLGAGGFGRWDGGKVLPVAETQSRDCRIVANGNVYSAFVIHYNHWQLPGGAHDLAAQVSMQAGSRLAHVQVRAGNSGSSAFPQLAIGVVKHPGTKLLLSDDKAGREWGYAASWGKQSRIAPEEYLGMGVIFHRSKRVQQTEDGSSHVSVMDTGDGQLEYYFFAAWDKEPGGIRTEADFRAFLENETLRLSQPLILTIH